MIKKVLGHKSVPIVLTIIVLGLLFLPKNRKCYFDGSYLRGTNDKIVEHWLRKGDEHIWKYLQKQYYQTVKHIEKEANKK